MKSICLSLASAAKDIPPPPRVWSTASSQLYQPRSLPLPTDMNQRSPGVHKKWVSKQICQPTNLMWVRLISAVLTWGINLKLEKKKKMRPSCLSFWLQSGEVIHFFGTWSSFICVSSSSSANTSAMSCSLITSEGENTRGNIILQRFLIIQATRRSASWNCTCREECDTAWYDNSFNFLWWKMLCLEIPETQGVFHRKLT